MPTAAVAALSLVLGFGVADVTGVRPLGGLVLLAGVAWCVRAWAARGVRPVVSVGLVVLYAAAFAASHALGDVLGAWGAVFAVAAVVGTAVFVLADRPGGARAAW